MTSGCASCRSGHTLENLRTRCLQHRLITLNVHESLNKPLWNFKDTEVSVRKTKQILIAFEYLSIKTICIRKNEEQNSIKVDIKEEEQQNA